MVYIMYIIANQKISNYNEACVYSNHTVRVTERVFLLSRLAVWTEDGIQTGRRVWQWWGGKFCIFSTCTIHQWRGVKYVNSHRKIVSMLQFNFTYLLPLLSSYFLRISRRSAFAQSIFESSTIPMYCSVKLCLSETNKLRGQELRS